MRIIDRLFLFIAERNLNPYAFEKRCEVSNGYLMKQRKGKGSIGSDIIEKIHRHFSDLSLIWLLTGDGPMLTNDFDTSTGLVLREGKPEYSRDAVIRGLNERISLLERSLADKEKIIQLMERNQNPGAGDRGD